MLNMLKRACALAFACALAVPLPMGEVALAQTAQPIGTCGSGPSYQANGLPMPLTQDTTGKLCTASSASLSGSTSNATDGQATSSTNLPTVAYLYAWNGTGWDRLQVDASKFLKVNCAAGCSGGTFNNNADGVATSATNGQAAAWLYAWNGTGWDRLQVDGSKNLKAVIAAALPAGSNVIGHVIADTGSTTAVTGNVTVVGNVASLGTDSGNPVKMGCVFNSALPAPTNGQRVDCQANSNGAIITASALYTTVTSGTSARYTASNADALAVAATANSLTTNSFGWNYNGTTWDRLYSATAAAGTTGTGVQAAGAMGFDGTNYQRLKTTTGGEAYVQADDPCVASTKSYGDFESTSSGGSIITAVSAKKAYICSVSIITSAAANVSLIEGTGSSVCTGGTPAGVFLNTGVTAANGAAFAANGGINTGASAGTIAANATANQNICVAFTTTNSPQVNVHVAYVQQ